MLQIYSKEIMNKFKDVHESTVARAKENNLIVHDTEKTRAITAMSAHNALATAKSTMIAESVSKEDIQLGMQKLEFTKRALAKDISYEDIQSKFRQLAESQQNKDGNLASLNESGQLALTKEGVHSLIKSITESTQVTSDSKNIDFSLFGVLSRTSTLLVATDVVGLNPLNVPSGSAYYMRTMFADGKLAGKETFNKIFTEHTGDGTEQDFMKVNPFEEMGYTYAEAIETSKAEMQDWNKLKIVIDSMPIKVGTRQIRANVTAEAIADIQNVHNIDILTILDEVLSNQLAFDINRNILNEIYINAVVGYESKNGVYDVNLDADGRFGAEKLADLLNLINDEANAVWFATRRARADVLITSMRVAARLATLPSLSYANGLSSQVSIDNGIIGSDISYVGTLLNGIKVYVDPFLMFDGFVVGYSGTTSLDGGITFCPYIMGERFEAPNFNNLSEKGFGYKSRYDIVNSPFVLVDANEEAKEAGKPAVTSFKGINYFYRKVVINGLSGSKNVITP